MPPQFRWYHLAANLPRGRAGMPHIARFMLRYGWSTPSAEYIPMLHGMTETVGIANVTRRTMVGNRVRLARSSRDRTVGLLRTPELKPGEGLWIERAPSIHMFFMRYPIDAVFVSKDGRVTRLCRT